MTEQMPWYSARLLFEARVEGEPSLFEERIVLVRSTLGSEDAAKKARKLGETFGSEYANVDGESVTWRFVEVLDLVQLTETVIRDGSEVYFHLLTHDEVEQIRRSLKSGSLP